ncbi:WG repeat-containing protein [Leptospira sp. 2 VSF19]|uniref:WG repeat-containing protein n=1 Tax=Leptospira soteropolitanensis TaxID=2950025 RepID=A0AAW5VLY0_9LEPT|nr:WG repeat-containing protein [Leptospira soteropolitanensis]MCW7494604.1 WG repeat-containing protein [Leptospira soteropolitanensis]MCW7502228.1 WG repeat-containing protein [Leptospira soteropolitanensis]MCW7524450.1 WG repeat-containing protein [Leptospira soteropolitanensis]MCW7528316.1 WG repeat-containing protein [Leptospira soteropolitanensis]MCW7532169.1 WG repeat-containing protein [Leptospira soteropolitanensis]
MKFIFTFLLFSIPIFAKPSLPISFEENNLFGFKNKSGKVIIKPQYQHALDFTKEKVAFVVKENQWVCIDTKNQVLLETFVYDNGPDYYSENLARFVENKKFGFFDSRCRKQISAAYDFVYPFENGLSIVCNGCESIPEGEHSRIVGGKYGVINKKGKVVIPIEWDAIESIDFKKKSATVISDKTKRKIDFK